MHDRKHLRSSKDDEAMNDATDGARHLDQHAKMETDNPIGSGAGDVHQLQSGGKVVVGHAENGVARSESVKNVFKFDKNEDFLSRLQKSPAPPASSHSDQESGAVAPRGQTDKGPLSMLNSLASHTPSPAAASPAPSNASSSAAAEGRVTRSQTAAERESDSNRRGLTGLYNLGNTCFMNSALQCMSNTKELKDYFVSGVYKSEVNTSNPLGMGGAMAKVFGELLTKLWSGGHGAWHPREFKTVLSRFSPQFIGYAQQDTQELLAFLLDGLHEDLNRIVKKPYIESPDWEGGGLKEMVAFAHKQWDIYKMRNDSVIVDLFQGQYRSTLICPDCAKVSIKFDPFMYLTLPIPNRKALVRKVTFVGLNGKTVEAEMRLTNEVAIHKLKSMLAEWFGVADAKCLVACDVFSRSFYRVYTDFEAANEIGTNDVTYVYQLPSPLVPVAPDSSQRYGSTVTSLERTAQPPKQAEQFANLPLFSMSVGKRNQFHSYSSRGSKTLFGQPMFISVPKDEIDNVDAIQSAVMQAYLSHASDPAALQAFLDKKDAHSPEATPNEDWEMLGESKVLPSSQTSYGDEEGTVAEIRADGEEVTFVADVSRTDNGSDAMDGVQTADDETASVTPVFSLHFVVHREDQAPTTLKPENFEMSGEELGQRAKRLGLDVEEGKGKEHARWPLVYSGGALVCVWSEEARSQFFEKNDEAWSKPQETFTDPALEVERKPETESKKKRSLTIDDCLNEFTKEEQLGESDPWYCPRCKEFKQATKKFDLWKVPDILVVHLKRFSSGRISRDKIDSVIDFPIDGLDLTDRVVGAQSIRRLHEEEGEEDDRLMDSIGSLDANDDAVESDAPIYDLYAVDNHFGGLGGGHYTAYAKNPENEKWYYFDDSSVRPVRSPDEMKSSAAYLLFYRRRTTRPIGGKSREKIRQRVRESEERGEGLAEHSQDINGGGGGDQQETTSDGGDEITSGNSTGRAQLGWQEGYGTEKRLESTSVWKEDCDAELPAYATIDDHDYQYKTQQDRPSDIWSGVYGAQNNKRGSFSDDDTVSLTAQSSDDDASPSTGSLEDRRVAADPTHLATGGAQPLTTTRDQFRSSAYAVEML